MVRLLLPEVRALDRVLELPEDYIPLLGDLAYEESKELSATIETIQSIAAKRAEITKIRQELREMYLTLPSSGSRRKWCLLSDRQREMLLMLGRCDMQLQHVARKIGISMNTANTHSTAIKEALNCNTTGGAIYAGCEKGII